MPGNSGLRAASAAQGDGADIHAQGDGQPPLAMTARRVLFVADSLDVGGAERVLVELAGGLVARGARVAVACSVGGALAVQAEQAGIKVVVLGSTLVKRRVDRDFADALARLIALDAPEVVHSHMYASTAAAAFAVEGIGVPLVIHEHSEAHWRNKQARRRIADAYRRCRAVIAVSGPIRQRLVELDQVAPEKVHVVTNALPALPPVAEVAMRVALSQCQRGPLVGVVARLEPEKGVEIFLRAVRLLARRFPAAHFVVVGDGRQRAALENFAAHRGLPVTFLGFRLDGPALVGQLDLLVVPSFSEGTPLVVLEAAGAGVPVVATAVGGIPDQLRDGIEVLLVPAGDASALADACGRIMNDPGLGMQLATAARHRAEQHYQPHAALDAVEAIYRSLLDVEAARSDPS